MTKSALQEILTRQDPLSDAALDSLIAHREEELYVDYKESFDRGEKGWLDLTIDVMSFANTNGGFLLFGVRDASFEPVGLAEDVAGVLSDTNLFIQKVNRFISPPVSLLRSKRFIRNGMTFVAVYIPESVGKTHVVVKEGAYILPSGEKRILLRLGMIFTRRSASNQVVTPEDLDLIIQRRLEHFRASLLGKIARVVEAPPEHQILVFDPRSTSSGENTFVISDAPEAIPIKGMSFTIAPQTDEQEIASWMALAGKDTDFLPRPQQLWLLYSKRHSLKLSTPQKGTGHLLARKRWILREADFTFGSLHKRGGYAQEHPECEPHGMPRRRRRLQVSPT